MRRWWMLAVMALCLGACVPALAEEDDENEWDAREERLPEHEVRAFLDAHLPHMIEELDHAREEDADEYEDMLEEVSEHIRHYREMKAIAPDVADALLRSHQLERQCEELAGQYHDAESDRRREELMIQIRQLLSEVFDLRLREPELEIRHLEAEIAKIKSVIERRKANKEKIVERRLKEMLGEHDEELSWW